MSMWMIIVACVFLVLGLFFMLVGAIGIVRFPDAYNRLHASSKCGTLGLLGLLLGAVFFLAVLLVKPIGVSTQFVILDGILWNAVSPTAVTETAEGGYTSSNAYLAKSDGKYAKSVANPLNYSFVFVLAMALGGFLSAMLRGA